MLNIKGRYFALAGTLAAAGGLAFAMAPAAHATTGACQSALGTQCGTFASVDLETTPHAVFWDVFHGTARANTPVLGYGNNSAQDSATDITKVEHRGPVPSLPASNSRTISYSFVYTPNGHWSNLCVADTGTHRLSLRTCNGGQYQRFIAQSTAPGGGGTSILPFTGIDPTAHNTTAGGPNGNRIFNNFNPVSFALLNVAYRLYVQDTSHASSFGPPASPDTRVLVDAHPATTTFGHNEVWEWTS